MQSRRGKTWFAFRENFDRRIALGMGLIIAGGAMLMRVGVWLHLTEKREYGA